MSDNDVEMADPTPGFPHQDLNHEEFREFSLKHWPESTLAGPGNSGITCLIATIRHLLGFIPQAQRNDVLRFADEAEQEQGVPKNQRGVLRAILLNDVQEAVEQIKEIFPQDTTCSFESLIVSHPYRRSMWNNSVLQLERRRAVKPKAEPDAPWSKLEPRSSRLPHFTWDGSADQTLSQHISMQISMQFGLLKTSKWHLVVVPQFPKLISLKYVSTNKSRHHYPDLSHFDMAVDYPDSAVRSVRYEAAVVVRLRDDKDGLDSLRLYGEYSTPLRQALSAPWSNDWSIEQGGAFMIFYVRNKLKFPVQMPAPAPVESHRSMSPERDEFYQGMVKELQSAGTEDEKEQDDADNGESVTPVQDLSNSPNDAGQEATQAEKKTPSPSPPRMSFSLLDHRPTNSFFQVGPSTHPFGSALQSAATKPLSDSGDLDGQIREPSPSPSQVSGRFEDDH